MYLMSSFWLCGGVGRAARMSTLFTSSVTDSVRAKHYLEPNYNLSEDHVDERARFTHWLLCWLFIFLTTGELLCRSHSIQQLVLH